MAETKEKKPRKPRKDKGTKRGKRTKNPRLQTGSIEFKHIGTTAKSETKKTKEPKGTNLTTLVGTLATLPRQIQPNLPQPYNPKKEEEKKKKEKEELQQFISTELAKYAPRDLSVTQPQNIPQPPQERPDVQQAQEEVADYKSQVEDLSRQVAAYKLQKVALTSNVRNTRKQAEKEKQKFEKELQDMENYGRLQQELQNQKQEEFRQQSENAAAELTRQSEETERLRQANILAEGDLRRQVEESEKLKKQSEQMRQDILYQDSVLREIGNPPRIISDVLTESGVYQSASQEPPPTPPTPLVIKENIQDYEDEPQRNLPSSPTSDEERYESAKRGETEARGQSQARVAPLPLPPRTASIARQMPIISELKKVASPPTQVDLTTKQLPKQETDIRAAAAPERKPIFQRVEEYKERQAAAAAKSKPKKKTDEDIRESLKGKPEEELRALKAKYSVGGEKPNQRYDELITKEFYSRGYMF